MCGQDPAHKECSVHVGLLSLSFPHSSFLRWENWDWEEGNDWPTCTQLIRRNCTGNPGQTPSFPAHPSLMTSAFPGSSHVLMWLSSCVLLNLIFFPLFTCLITVPYPVYRPETRGDAWTVVLHLGCLLQSLRELLKIWMLRRHQTN